MEYETLQKFFHCAVRVTMGPKGRMCGVKTYFMRMIMHNYSDPVDIQVLTKLAEAISTDRGSSYATWCCPHMSTKPISRLLLWIKLR
ncbi:unnamed protein product [Clonostachys rosea f. rosea IK726]|uniref:Uncharacterized protein n=1 Tax=Clonostachys rosea f. rosea IK726 TaxID=1349383 RepID=A0ACA9UHG2_BIOOC|nr:unnamed protein product [Clonostachys rosea f. rosea IK726]